MEYTDLTDDEQEQILAQRKKQYEQEHFNHSINKELLVATGQTDKETLAAIAQSDAAMTTLDGAHAETVKRIKKIRDAKKKA